jgi:hypothetical protein
MDKIPKIGGENQNTTRYGHKPYSKVLGWAIKYPK